MSNFQPEGCIKGSTRNAYLVKFIILDQRCSCHEVGLVWSFPSSLLPVTVSSHLELPDWYLIMALNHLCYLWLSETFMDFESFNHFHGLNLQSLIQTLFANGFESLISIYWMIFCSAADLCAVCDFSLPNSRTVADLFLWIKWRPSPPLQKARHLAPALLLPRGRACCNRRHPSHHHSL